MADSAISLRSPFALTEQPSAPELLGKYFRALGDPTRVRVLALLREHGELSVGGLVERLAVSQPKVSNHLACLRWCGFVARRRDHPSVLYRIADARVAQLLALGEALLDDNADQIAACRRVDAPGLLMAGRDRARHTLVAGADGRRC